MTAICKTIPVHGAHLNSLLDYGSDQEKTSLANEDALTNLFNYAKNESKTSFINPLDNEKSLLVTGVQCIPERADQDFKDVRDKYRHTNNGVGVKQEPLTAIHLIQSFKETSISPVVAHKIGIELLNRLGYMGVVDTHMNKTHVHNHIIINAYIPGKSTKVHLNKSFIMSVRKLSDDIQLEYGIPIDFDSPKKQLEKSKDSMAYGEWAAQRNHSSWKADLFQSMLICSSSASSREEYIQLMNRFGYQLSSEKSNGDMVWYNLAKTKKIKESTLYREFTDSSLRHIGISYKHFDYLETGYSWDGRQLTDIENILRETYNTISLVANFIASSKHKLSNRAYNLDFKHSELKWAHNYKQLYDIDSINTLNVKLNDVGTSISVLKKQIADIESIHDYSNMTNEYVTSFIFAKKAALQSGIDKEYLDNLFLPTYSNYDIALENAKIAPLSGSQKKELHLLLKKHPEVRLSFATKSFQNISTIDYYNITNYFKNGGEMPACLCSKNDFNIKMAYERQYESLRNRFSYPLTEKQKSECISLLSKNGLDTSSLDLSSLTLADLINIQNCYGPSPDLNIVKPGIATRPSSTDLERCIQIIKEKGLIPGINPKDMTSAQCSRFYSWACSQDMKPICVNSVTNEKTLFDSFNKSISNLSSEQRSNMLSFRDAAIKLYQVGMNIDDVETYINNYHDFEETLFSLKRKQTLFNNQYKDLIHLKQILSFSMDTNYVYGNSDLKKDFIEHNKSKLYYQKTFNNLQKDNQKHHKENDIDFEF